MATRPYPRAVARITGRSNSLLCRKASDEEALAWCFAQGRKPSEEEILVFNSFLSKRGWRDDASAALKESKRERGFGDREDIQTFFDFHKADEQEG